MWRSMTQIVLAVAMLISGAGRVHGESILFSTLGPGDAFDMSGGTSFSFSAPAPPLVTRFRFAMPFEVPGGGDVSVSSVVLPLASVGEIASVEIQLLSSIGGSPDLVLESIPVTSRVSSTPDLVTAISSTFPALQGGGTYFLAVDVRPQLTTSSRWGLNTFSGDPKGPNVEVWDAVNSEPLTSAGPSPVGFTIRAIPEPSTLAMVAAGILLTLGLGWRRRDRFQNRSALTLSKNLRGGLREGALRSWRI